MTPRSMSRRPVAPSGPARLRGDCGDVAFRGRVDARTRPARARESARRQRAARAARILGLAAALAAAGSLSAAACRPEPASGPVAELRPESGEGIAGWLVSTWPAGQSERTRWSENNVRWAEDGALELVLAANAGAGTGATGTGIAETGGRPMLGGEIQSRACAAEGRWTWRVQAPRMVPGAVFGLFLFQARYGEDPWLEFDIEFVGEDTTQFQIDIHIADEEGRRRSLGQMPGGPPVVELPFDAAAGMHDYSIELVPNAAIFRVDGEEVGRFGPEDMPGGVWRTGPVRSFVDLWAVAPPQEAWAGRWSDPGRPLVARIEALGLPSADIDAQARP